jgi:hypothetical protein
MRGCLLPDSFVSQNEPEFHRVFPLFRHERETSPGGNELVDGTLMAHYGTLMAPDGTSGGSGNSPENRKIDR